MSAVTLPRAVIVPTVESETTCSAETVTGLVLTVVISLIVVCVSVDPIATVAQRTATLKNMNALM